MSEPETGRTISTLGEAPAADVNSTGVFPADSPLRVWLCAALIVFAGAGAFSATLGVPFHFEDRLLIAENTSVHRVATVQEAFGLGDAGPVVWLVHAFNWLVSPNNAAVFHGVNLALHLANALLIFFICRLFIRPGENDPLPWIPFAAGLLFALHPLTTESVNYVVGRAPILATTFSLGAMLALLSLDVGAPVRRRLSLIALIACVVLALGSHRAAWILPIVLIAADWCRNGSEIRRRIPIHGLMIAATIGVVVATAFGGTSVRNNEITPLQLEADLPPQVAIARAADLTINRRPLSTVQSAELDSVVVEFAGKSVENFAPTNVVPGIALVALAAVGGIVALWFRHLLGLGLIWYASALVFGAVWARNGLPFSERAVYVPLAGLAIAAAGALTFIGGRQRVRVAAAACVCILLAICAIASFTRSRTWLDEQALWELARDTAAKSPVPYHRLAVLHGELGDAALADVGTYLSVGESVPAATAQQHARDAFGRAAEYAQSAVNFGANENPLRVLLGRSLHLSGSSEEAETVLMDVLRADPTDRPAIAELAAIHDARANATGDRTELARAADLYERAMILAPPTHNELARYGRVVMRLGDLNSAQTAFARAVQMQPDGPMASTLTDLNGNLQRIAGIEQQAAQLGLANPNDPNGPMTFALAGVERNDFMRVLYTLTGLLETHPNFVPAWVTLGFTQARMGQADSFLEHYGTAPVRFPDADTLLSRFSDDEPDTSETSPAAAGAKMPPWLELASACVRYNLWDAAAQYLLHAGENSGDSRLPLVIVAQMALEQGNLDRYRQFLLRATEEHAESPVPWLMICDMSIQLGNAADATQALTEAETRGASAEELDARKPEIEALQKGGLITTETVS